MIRYVAFLRGINISGKNKIAMLDLKKEFEKLNFSDVVTFLNSGNVLFSSPNDNHAEIKEQIEIMIDNAFGFKIPVYIIRYDYLQDILVNAPQWWGTEEKDQYHIVEENNVLKKWYESFGFVHIGTQKFDFFPFTCGYMEKNIDGCYECEK